jgi:hypothetical protein
MNAPWTALGTPAISIPLPVDGLPLGLQIVADCRRRCACVENGRPFTRGVSMLSINPHLVTTAFELPGYRTVQNFGVVRALSSASRSIVGSIGAGLQTLIGGNITLFTELCEHAREDAFP